MADPTDTICALSTPPGRSGLAVIRVSGPGAAAIYGSLFRPRTGPPAPPHGRAVLGRIVDPAGGADIDEAVALYYRAPKSYTGEDLTEYSIHGSPVLVDALLDCLCRSGARLAVPGEFTMRAFLNGKMDLAEAEAVRDTIDAATLYQAQVAARQRWGGMAEAIGPVRERLTGLIAGLETAVEFVEQDLAVDGRAEVTASLGDLRGRLRKWIDSFERGRIVREGFSLAVVGRPNAGKSSCFNALLGQERSIVMDLPGTTRDLVSEHTSIGGIPVRLLDTAGVGAPGDPAAMIGADRTYRAIADADAVLLVVDRSRGPGGEDLAFRDHLKPLRCIAVFNKSDLGTAWTPGEILEFAGVWPSIEVSAKTGAGIDRLRGMIFESLFGPGTPDQGGLLVTNLRHRQCLQTVEAELEKAANALGRGLSEEFALVHLHQGLKALGAITGETSVEDILEEIFSRFCIGK